MDTSTFEGFVAALERRRAYFKANGATATDYGPPDPGSEPLAGRSVSARPALHPLMWAGVVCAVVVITTVLVWALTRH